MRPAQMTAILCLALASTTLAGRAPQLPSPALDPNVSGASRPPSSPAGASGASRRSSRALDGVKDVVSGYAGGSKSSANYRVVSSGTTGHAESVRITYDPAKISYGQLLKVFFAVAHDPTQLNRQGPDEGPQYRSAIFFSGPEQKSVAEAYITQLNDAKIFPRRIVTTVVDARRLLPRRGRAPGLRPAQPVEPVRPRPRQAEDRAPREGFPGAAQA